MHRRHAVVAGGLALIAVAVAAAFLYLARPVPPPAPDRVVLTAVDFAALPGWTEGRQGGALAALARSCERLGSGPAERRLGGGDFAGRVADWLPACAALAKVAPEDAAARAFLERWFIPFALRNNDRAEGLFTGYYEPELKGSLTPGGVYRVPLYARPRDLVTVDLGRFRDDLEGRRVAGRVVEGVLRPYESRAEIERGALAGRAEPLVWVDDPVDAFFLHVQGSGRIVLPDGRVLRLGYAGQNGRAYVAIGRELVGRGALALGEVSLQSIRDWLLRHPAEAPEVMARNPSFIFFRILEGEGPVGAQGVVLTPGRSLAVDRRFIPLGVPLWLDGLAPAAEPGSPDRRFRRLLVAQDTGGAIKGPVRGDVFWGAGAEAEAVAGRMKHAGRYFVLLPRALTPGGAPTE